MLFHRKKRACGKAEDFSLSDEALERIDMEFPDETDDDEFEKPKRKRFGRLIFKLTAACLIVVAINLGILFLAGAFSLNEPKKRDYPTRGAVVTDELGEIKWGAFSKQNISFAYMRATKGKSFVDKSFEKSWSDSAKAELLTGAYHDFDFNADGEKQAENFCNELGESLSGRLMPAVDVSMNLLEKAFKPGAGELKEDLQAFIDHVSQKYDCGVIIICDKSSYEDYIGADFAGYPVWVKSTVKSVDFTDDWDIWQYSDSGKTEGYENSDEHYPQLVAAQSVTVEQFKEQFLIE